MIILLLGLIVILAYRTVCLVFAYQSARLGLQSLGRSAPRGRLLLLQAGSLVLKVEVQVV